MILENVKLIDEAMGFFPQLYELEDYERKTPGSVTSEMWKKTYNYWIQTYLDQAYGGFKIKNFMTSPDCLILAEQTLMEAREKGFEFDESIIGDIIGKILDLEQVNNFAGNRRILSYIKSSNLDLGEYEKKIDERLPELAIEYSKALVRDAKNAARRMKNLGKVHYVGANIVKSYLDAIENLEPYEIDEKENIVAVRERAYKSILFALNVAKDSAYNNPGKSRRWLEMASKNASVLGYDISHNAKIINDMQNSFGLMEIDNNL